MTKKMVKKADVIREFSFLDYEDEPISTLVEDLKAIEAKGVVKLGVDHNYEGYELFLWDIYEREETDYEYELRLKREQQTKERSERAKVAAKKAKENKEAKERAEFERLKAKFGEV